MTTDQVTAHISATCLPECVFCSGVVRLGGSTFEEERDDQ